MKCSCWNFCLRGFKECACLTETPSWKCRAVSERVINSHNITISVNFFETEIVKIVCLWTHLSIMIAIFYFLARFPNAFAANPSASAISTSSSLSSAAVPGVSNPAASSSSLDTLKIEEVKAPATGTRKAKVLYDYDAADTSELSLLADEVGYTLSCTLLTNCFMVLLLTYYSPRFSHHFPDFVWPKLCFSA